MACGATLKRSVEFEALMSPQSPKRRRCVPLQVSPAPSPSQRCGHRTDTQQAQPATQLGADRRLTPEQIFQNLKQEYTRYQRQRHLDETFSQIESGSSLDGQASFSPLTTPASPGNENQSVLFFYFIFSVRQFYSTFSDNFPTRFTGKEGPTNIQPATSRNAV
ncbi:akirin-1 [Pelobates cultripes]|uniref:Akirin-1 n=1 Tax=Pelobates cultripes TaxID=61616 RepID=A0AAD1R3N2_PELCU|nr:akirin-1 [Pelobates cultripes]